MAKKKTSKKTAKKITKKIAGKPAKKTTKKIQAKKKAPAKKVVSKKSPAKKAPARQSAEIIKSASLKPGEMAPEFTLTDQNGKLVSLKDYRGRNVVVYFYPKAMTPGCTVQACEIRDSYARLNDLDVVILGISPDPVKKLKQFEDKKELNFTLLSDSDHGVAELYHSWGLKKFMGREYMGVLRQSFFIDKNGKILHVMHKVETANHHQVVIDFFKNLG